MPKRLQEFIQTEYTSRDVPDFKVGDVVQVHQLVPDIKAHEVGKKLSKTARAALKARMKEEIEQTSRVQVFEGVVIARKHGAEPGATFTVRKIASGGVGVEKIFPLYSPLLKKIAVVSRPGRVRRAKLYFLRDRIGKKARKFGTGGAVTQKVTSVSDMEIPGEEDAPEPENVERAPEDGIHAEAGHPAVARDGGVGESRDTSQENAQKEAENSEGTSRDS